jgi:hypothetical protein
MAAGYEGEANTVTGEHQAEHRRRRYAAHERAALAHERGAAMHEGAARFFDSHDAPEAARRERSLAELNCQDAAMEHRSAFQESTMGAQADNLLAGAREAIARAQELIARSRDLMSQQAASSRILPGGGRSHSVEPQPLPGPF